MNQERDRRRGCGGCLGKIIILAFVFLLSYFAAGFVFGNAIPGSLFRSDAGIVSIFEDFTSGDTQGDSWRFDEELRPYYANLNKDEKRQYRKMVKGLLAGETKVYFDRKLTEDQAISVMNAIEFDQPDIFWYSEYTITMLQNSVSFIEIKPLYSDSELQECREQLDFAVKEITDPISEMSSFDQEKAAFDAVINSCVYDGSGIDQGQGSYAALVEGKAVCAGYSRAFQLILLRLNIPCYYVPGQAQGQDFLGTGWGPHAWNIVKIDGLSYNVDVTWGDCGVMGGEGILYQYFNVTDESISVDHERDDASQILPACTTPFDFLAVYGTDPAAASLQSAGYSVDCIVYSSDEYVSSVVSRASELGTGNFRFIAVVYGMDESDIDAMHSLALDSLVGNVFPGVGMTYSGTIQLYSPGVYLVVDDYAVM